MPEPKAKTKVAARIEITKNVIEASCPKHRELAKSKNDLIKDRTIILEAGEAECKYCRDIIYFWPEIDANIWDPQE